jgi:PilZ domain
LFFLLFAFMKSTKRQRGVAECSDNRQAERFAIRVPVRYRAFGESDWHIGMTENISGGGIFFRCNQLAELHKPVQIDFVLRCGRNEPFGTQVACLGEIVRSEPQSGTGQSILAARIQDYRLSPWQGRKM